MILIFLKLLRMVSFSADHTTLHEACQTVLELIEEISAIPIDYLRAMSLAMVTSLFVNQIGAIAKSTTASRTLWIWSHLEWFHSKRPVQARLPTPKDSNVR